MVRTMITILALTGSLVDSSSPVFKVSVLNVTVGARDRNVHVTLSGLCKKHMMVPSSVTSLITEKQCVGPGCQMHEEYNYVVTYSYCHWPLSISPHTVLLKIPIFRLILITMS